MNDYDQTMDDPLADIVDEPLLITEQVIVELASIRNVDYFVDLPGVDNEEEIDRLSLVLDDLLDRLVAGIQEDPNKLWVMSQFLPSLEAVHREDTEAREHFGIHLEQIMDVLQIESSDGLCSSYL